MILLLISFGLGVMVGASSWLLAAAWLQSRFSERDVEYKESDVPGLLPDKPFETH